MRQSCRCGTPMNVAYIYRKKGRTGEWVSIGHYCVNCGAFLPEKKVKLKEEIKLKTYLSS